MDSKSSCSIIIFGGNSPLYLQESEHNYSYQINSGDIFGEKIISLNNTSKFLELSRSLRNEYTEYIYSLNSLFLEQELIYDGNLSMFFLTDLSNKRTETYDTYQSICHLIILYETISKIPNLNKIILYKVPMRFVKAVKSLFRDKEIIERHIINQPKFLVPRLYLNQCLFFSRTFIQIFMLKIFRLNETLKASPSRTFFLTRYPKHFSKSNKDEKYGNCLNPDDLYLISIIADGMHQNVSLVNSYKYIRELQKTKIRFICLDKYISLTDILVSFLKSFTITARFMKIINSEFRFGKIDISLFVTDELTTSVLRIPRLMMYKNSLINLMHKHKPQRFVYYLFEFCYGRFFTYIFKQYFPNIHTIGFQHGPNSQRHIMFYLAVDEGSYQSHDYLRFLPMPNEVLAENKQAQLVYETGGYRNIKLMDRIYRLDYLDKINRKNIVGDSVLVAAALHDGYQLFRYLTQYMKENENITFFFKLHPLTNKNIFRYIERNKIKNTIIAHKELYYYLSIVSEVIVTQSSVGYEAYILGIPVRVISLPNKINDSCLVDIYENGEKKNITIDHFL